MTKLRIPFLYFLSILLVSFQLISCKTSKNVPNSKADLDKSLLWKVTGPGLTKPSYVFGTIHLIDADDYFLPKGTMSALDEVNNVVFELDMKEMSDMSKLMGMMNKLYMNEGKTLKDLLTDAEYKAVGDFFQEKGLPLFMFERMKPMFLSIFASGDMDPGGLQNGNMKSYEMELLEMAENSGKSTSGLETIDFQISLFDAIPYEAQAKMLVESIQKGSNDDEDDEFKKMTAMYKSQDINAMVRMISEEGSDVSGFEDKLLVERNRNWIPLMIEMAKKQPTLFAVGAGHLGGHSGVLRLLMKEGYKLTPMSKE
jgi:uncharacterized protein YbaP (TraB family)